MESSSLTQLKNSNSKFFDISQFSNNEWTNEINTKDKITNSPKAPQSSKLIRHKDIISKQKQQNPITQIQNDAGKERATNELDQHNMHLERQSSFEKSLLVESPQNILSFQGKKDKSVNQARIEPQKPKKLKSLESGLPQNIINASPLRGKEAEQKQLIATQNKVKAHDPMQQERSDNENKPENRNSNKTLSNMRNASNQDFNIVNHKWADSMKEKEYWDKKKEHVEKMRQRDIEKYPPSIKYSESMAQDLINKRVIDDTKKDKYKAIHNRKERYKFKQAYENQVRETSELNKQNDISRITNRASQVPTVAKFERGQDIVSNNQFTEDRIVKELQGHANRTKYNIAAQKQPPNQDNIGHDIPYGDQEKNLFIGESNIKDNMLSHNETFKFDESIRSNKYDFAKRIFIDLSQENVSPVRTSLKDKQSSFKESDVLNQKERISRTPMHQRAQLSFNSDFLTKFRDDNKFYSPKIDAENANESSFQHELYTNATSDQNNYIKNNQESIDNKLKDSQNNSRKTKIIHNHDLTDKELRADVLDYSRMIKSNKDQEKYIIEQRQQREQRVKSKFAKTPQLRINEVNNLNHLNSRDLISEREYEKSDTKSKSKSKISFKNQ